MNTHTYKRRKRFTFPYERRYEQLSKYPRRSEIKEAFIRYNIYPRINLYKKKNGGTRLRERKKVSYAVDFEDSLTERFEVTRPKPLRRPQTNKNKTNSRSTNTSYGSSKGSLSSETDSISMAELMKKNKSNVSLRSKGSTKTTSSRKKQPKPKNIRTKAKKDLPASEIKGKDATEAEEDVFNDIIFVKGERPDPEDFKQNDIYELLSRPEDTIKISNKDIKKITGKHCPLSGKVLSKEKPCLLCDMKLYNYIIHKRIQSTRYSENSMMLNFDDEIEISASLLISKLNIDKEYITQDFFHSKKQ